MAIIDLIEFFDPTGEIIVTKEPQDASAEFRLGSQLIVQESQLAVFYRDGKALDGFTAGRHTLVTQNLPLLGSLIAAPFGGESPFRAYVYFLALKTFTGLGWGTPNPIMFRDAEFRMVSLRANGTYSIRISEPRIFLHTIVGTKGLETTFHLEDFLRSLIVSHFNAVLGIRMKSLLDLPAQYGIIASNVKQEVRSDFKQYGIELVDLVVNAITVPNEVQEMLNKATAIAAQDPEKYRSIATSDAIRDVARNSRGGGDLVGAGVGVGMGLGVAKEFAQALVPPAQPIAPAPAAPSIPPAITEDIRRKLSELKALHQDKLISDTDFEEHKRRLLSQL
jgi:membrane protease subunit (stomatin/prohibitin family)